MSRSALKADSLAGAVPAWSEVGIWCKQRGEGCSSPPVFSTWLMEDIELAMLVSQLGFP